MNVARIVDGVVINLEVVDQEWLDGQTDKNVLFIEYADNKMVLIGNQWDGVEFSSPVVPDPAPTSSPVLVSN